MLSASGVGPAGVGEIRVESADGASYVLALDKVNAHNLTALFGHEIAFLEFDNRATLADSGGRFPGLVSGRTYHAVPKGGAPGGAAGDRSGRSMDALEERTEVLKVFRRFDTNKSGDIDEVEFRALCVELGREITPEKTSEIFQLIDTDKSGTIDFAEFYAWYTGSKRAPVAKLGGGLLNSLRAFGAKLTANPSKPVAPVAAVELSETAASSASASAAPAPAPSAAEVARSRASQRPQAAVAVWQDVAVAEGWRAPEAGSGFRGAQYAVLGSTVALRGCVVATNALAAHTLCTLPEEARPALAERFSCLKASGSGHPKCVQVTVNPNGTVEASSAGEIWLSGVTFVKA